MGGAVRSLGFGLLILGMTWAGGCSFDTAPNDDEPRGATSGPGAAPVAVAPTAEDRDRFPSGPQGTAAGAPGMNGGGADGPGDGVPGASGGAGVPGMDAEVPPGEPGEAGAGAQPPEEPPGPSAPNVAPGAPLSLCSIDAGCKAGLVCFDTDSQPGFCTERCEEDDDCGAQLGHDLGCDGEQQACRVQCEDGEDCPAGFQCEGSSAFSDGTCEPERSPGAGDRGPLEPCDVKRGDSDCVAGLVCYRWEDTRVDGPGYCTLPCESSSDCQATVAAGAELGCGGEGACRFICSDAPCPAFMECEEIAGMGGRCKYPDGTPY